MLLGIVMIVLSGCTKEVALNDDNSLLEIKQMIENNSKIIQELQNKNLELEKKISKLDEEKKDLNNKLVELQNSDNNISSTIDNRYNELKGIIDNKMVSSSNNYTITKQQLLGTWNIVGHDGSQTFYENNFEIVGNWIIFDDNNTLYYMYKDGKLYVADNGWIFTK